MQFMNVRQTLLHIFRQDFDRIPNFWHDLPFAGNEEEAEENQRQERNCEKFSASLKKPPI